MYRGTHSVYVTRGRLYLIAITRRQKDVPIVRVWHFGVVEYCSQLRWVDDRVVRKNVERSDIRVIVDLFRRPIRPVVARDVE